MNGGLNDSIVSLRCPFILQAELVLDLVNVLLAVIRLDGESIR